MTNQELEAERRYRITERLGIMCGTGKPTIMQQYLAELEADAAVEELRNEAKCNRVNASADTNGSVGCDTGQ